MEEEEEFSPEPSEFRAPWWRAGATAGRMSGGGGRVWTGRVCRGGGWRSRLGGARGGAGRSSGGGWDAGGGGIWLEVEVLMVLALLGGEVPVWERGGTPPIWS